MSIGSLPYEEYFFPVKRSWRYWRSRSLPFRDHRELICHLYICSDVYGGYKGSSNSLKSWVDYLFPSLESAPEEARFRVMEEDVLQMMREHDHGYVVLEENDNIYERGGILKSFYHQARQPISRKALLAGFLSVRLKRCVVSSPSSDDILPTALLQAVRLVRSRSLGLLPTMVCCIQ